MQIIHLVLGKANPNRMNGVNKVVYQLATNQAKEGRSVSVWGITSDLTRNFEERNFETKLFKPSSIPFQMDPLLKEAIRALKSQTVFHFHGGWIKDFFSIARFLHAHRIPYVLTPHGAYNRIAMKRSYLVKKIYFQLFERYLLNLAHCVHCIGESETDGVKALLPQKRISLIPYGFDIPDVSANNGEQRKENFIVGYMGRLDIHTKGLDVLLDAFDTFRQQDNYAKLWILGDGPDRNQLEQMIASKGMSNSVVLFGSLFGNEKYEVIKQMDVFVHPSRNEGLPASVLEVSALKIPSIVSQATNLAKYVTDWKSGLSIENENAESLSQALGDMKFAYETYTLSEMGERAAMMVNAVFNWKKLLGLYDSIYQDAMGET